MLTNDPVPFMTAKVTEHATNKVAFLCSSEREALHDVSVPSLQDIVWKCWKINNAELLAKLLELRAAGDGATCWVYSTFAFLCNPALHIHIQSRCAHLFAPSSALPWQDQALLG